MESIMFLLSEWKRRLIKHQTAMICYGKVSENQDLPVGQSYDI